MPVSYDLATIADAYSLFEGFEGEILLLEVLHNEYGFNLRLVSNGNGIAPIYVHQNGDRISFDWDSDRLVKAIKHKSLDFQYLCRAVVDPVYTHRTPFTNIQLLPPRTQLLWDGARLRVDQIDGGELEGGIGDYDASRFIIDHVDAHFAKRGTPTLPFAAELSGGIDSSFVTLSAFRAWERRGITLGIDIGFGAERRAQLERRDTVISAAGCRDFVVDIREYMPAFRLSADDLESRYLLAEEYEDAFTRLWSIARNEGCSIITGGYGGDELFPSLAGEEVCQDKLRGATEADRARIRGVYEDLFTPNAWQAVNDGFIGELDTGYLGSSARLAVIKRAPLLLSCGFWPVFPLFDETLAAALLTAAADQRHEKSALQDAIRLLLGERDIFGTYDKETLKGASDRSLWQSAQVVIQTLSTSRLIDIGILRADAIRTETVGDLADITNPYSPILSILYATEKFLRGNF
ncbi:asparagine synthase-related protein [Bradyrhizobium japonicum]|uniref:asparagine synthase-related protein n=1 Tax=Bradyrhizobium japonicum TaxID=375 RepID=UPI00200E7BB2|nr:asparagine synthase-related protein [Bradyrhizobium japonicum]UQE03615.1 hypothetical protein JEY30_47670 [Bradyrhizobium japonicum]